MSEHSTSAVSHHKAERRAQRKPHRNSKPRNGRSTARRSSRRSSRSNPLSPWQLPKWFIDAVPRVLMVLAFLFHAGLSGLAHAVLVLAELWLATKPTEAPRGVLVAVCCLHLVFLGFEVSQVVGLQCLFAAVYITTALAMDCRRRRERWRFASFVVVGCLHAIATAYAFSGVAGMLWTVVAVATVGLGVVDWAASQHHLGSKTFGDQPNNANYGNREIRVLLLLLLLGSISGLIALRWGIVCSAQATLLVMYGTLLQRFGRRLLHPASGWRTCVITLLMFGNLVFWCRCALGVRAAGHLTCIVCAGWLYFFDSFVPQDTQAGSDPAAAESKKSTALLVLLLDLATQIYWWFGPFQALLFIASVGRLVAG